VIGEDSAPRRTLRQAAFAAMSAEEGAELALYLADLVKESDVDLFEGRDVKQCASLASFVRLQGSRVAKVCDAEEATILQQMFRSWPASQILRYHGEFFDDKLCKTRVVVDDPTRGFDLPCVLCLKVGQTFEEAGSMMKRVQCDILDKLSTSAALNLRPYCMMTNNRARERSQWNPSQVSVMNPQEALEAFLPC